METERIVLYIYIIRQHLNACPWITNKLYVFISAWKSNKKFKEILLTHFSVSNKNEFGLRNSFVMTRD